MRSACSRHCEHGSSTRRANGISHRCGRIGRILAALAVTENFILRDSEIAAICAATYDPNAKWDFLLQGASDDDVFVGIKKTAGFDVVAFRGSEIKIDWLRDVEADIFDHPILGGVHRGFACNIDSVVAQLQPHLTQPIITTGHSLGAPRATYTAALLGTKGIPVAASVLMGSPRPGLWQLSELMLRQPVSSYKNRVDPVTTVPVPIPGAWYVHVRSQILLNVPPADLDHDPTPWIDFNTALEEISFADHHVELYQKGILDLEAQKA